MFVTNKNKIKKRKLFAIVIIMCLLFMKILVSVSLFVLLVANLIVVVQLPLLKEWLKIL